MVDMLDLATETSTDTSKSVREAPSRAHEHAAPLNNNTHITLLEVGDQVVVVVSMRSGQRFIKRCKAAKTAAGTGTILAK